MPTVALCIPIESRRGWLIDKLLPRWNALDLAGHDGVYVIGADDADAEQVARFRAAARWPVVIAGEVGGREPEQRDNWTCSNLIRLGQTRQRIADAALGAGVDYLWWIDSDTLPPVDALPFMFVAGKWSGGSGVFANYPNRTLGTMMRPPGGNFTAPNSARACCLAADPVMIGLGCALIPAATSRVAHWRNHPQRCRAHLSFNGVHEDRHIVDQLLLSIGPVTLVNMPGLCHYESDGSRWIMEAAQDGELCVRLDAADATDITRQTALAVNARQPRPARFLWKTQGIRVGAVITPEQPARLPPEIAASLRRMLGGNPPRLVEVAPTPDMPHLGDLMRLLDDDE